MLLDEARALQEELTAIRRDLHRHPELAFKEYRTTEVIAHHLRAHGVEAVPWGGETGLVGILRGDVEGPTIALRADIDGLPIEEANDVDYRSETPGVMHACGHDAHTACLLGAAILLARHRAELPVTVRFIFQAAEETVSGAQPMIAAGVLENPPVAAIFGLHVQTRLRAGTVGVTEGPAMAACDFFTLTLRGKGGHGAFPHLTHDPITAAGAVIQGVQTIVSRQINPVEPAVVSFGSIHGGAACNIIPETVVLQGTVRTTNAETRAAMPERLRAIAAHLAASQGVEVELDYRHCTPMVYNAPDLTAQCRTLFGQLLGPENLLPEPLVMGGEDFACYQEKVPGVFFWLGAGSPDRAPSWHNPNFDIDESCLPVGAACLAQLALEGVGS